MKMDVGVAYGMSDICHNGKGFGVEERAVMGFNCFTDLDRPNLSIPW